MFFLENKDWPIYITWTREFEILLSCIIENKDFAVERTP
jgi:hypothetical protein